MITLYSYFRSTAAYRVRIALQYKGIPFSTLPVNLATQEHTEARYKKENPQGRVPLLIDGDLHIGQSMAILEYLEEQYPTHPLLPKSAGDRAWVRYVTQIVVSDMHPLNNSSVLQYLENALHHSKPEILQWYFHWLTAGFDALEKVIAQKSNGQYCLHNQLTLADVCLIPQIFNAHRFGFVMDHYPTLISIYTHCTGLPFFKNASPEQQPDYVVTQSPFVSR